MPPLPKGLGEQIMVAFQIPPSKKIGDVRKALEECVVQGELPAQESIEYYVGFLKEHRVRFGI